MLHFVQAFAIDKTISTSNNKVQVSMQIWKNINSEKIKTLARVKGLGNSVRKTLANANSFIVAELQQLKVFLKLAPTLVFWA